MNLNIQEDCRTLEKFYNDPPTYHRMHYAFAHQFLPRYVHQNPRAFFSYLYDQQLPGGVMEPTTFIQSRWSMFTDLVGGLSARPDEPLAGNLVFHRVTDLSMSTLEVNNHASALIEMPKCYRPPEAYFVCVVLNALAAHVGSWPEDVQARIFTLEFEFARRPTGVICEWTTAGEHRNLGQGVPANRESFLKTVSDVLKHGGLPISGFASPPLQGKVKSWWKLW